MIREIPILKKKVTRSSRVLSLGYVRLGQVRVSQVKKATAERSAVKIFFWNSDIPFQKTPPHSANKHESFRTEKSFFDRNPLTQPPHPGRTVVLRYDGILLRYSLGQASKAKLWGFLALVTQITSTPTQKMHFGGSGGPGGPPGGHFFAHFWRLFLKALIGL